MLFIHGAGNVRLAAATLILSPGLVPPAMEMPVTGGAP
jgi:hypothetical protein